MEREFERNFDAIHRVNKEILAAMQKIESRISSIETRLDRITDKLDKMHRYPRPSWPDTSNIF
jgi:hypothetical protein